MENSLSYLFPVLLGFRGTHLWTNPEPGSFRKQVFLNVLGPLSHYPLSFLLSPFSIVSWDFICVQKGQEPSTGSKVVESSQLLWCPSKPPALTWTRESQKCWLHFLLNVLRKRRGPEEAPRDTQGGEDIGHMCGGDRDAGWVWKSKYNISGFGELLRPCKF